MSTTKAWRAGVSNAFTTPWTRLSSRTCVTVITPASASHASANDCTMDATCVATSTRYRPQRSTQTPANGASTKVGIWPAKPTRPSVAAEPVRR